MARRGGVGNVTPGGGGDGDGGGSGDGDGYETRLLGCPAHYDTIHGLQLDRRCRHRVAAGGWCSEL